jgi:hypothetical protein
MQNLYIIFASLSGESVPEEERTIVKDTTGELTLNSSSANLVNSVASEVTPLSRNLPSSAGAVAAVNDEERATWQQEKEKLYLQLDERVSENCCMKHNSQKCGLFYT